jgi:threonine/homoserine efflux transporter RhtA
MNKRQKTSVLFGVALVLLCGLYPPYEGVWTREGDDLTKYMGYSFLFAPPSQKQVYRAITGMPLSTSIPQSQLSHFSSNIVTSRVWLQVVTVVIAAAGLVFVLGGKHRF